MWRISKRKSIRGANIRLGVMFQFKFKIQQQKFPIKCFYPEIHATSPQKKHHTTTHETSLDNSTFYCHCSRHGPVVGPQGVVGVKQHSALATHVLLIRAGASDTSRAVHGGGVGAALGRGVSPQSDVAVLSPSGAPGAQFY